MICTISKHRAERRGYADAMMLDWQGRVAECTGANIFFAADGVLHTPIADCFLDGITRRTVIDLARRRGVEVIERRILPEELANFEECFSDRHRRGSDAGLRDRSLYIHARGALPRVRRGLFRRSAAEAAGRLIRRPERRRRAAVIAPRRRTRRELIAHCGSGLRPIISQAVVLV